MNYLLTILAFLIWTTSDAFGNQVYVFIKNNTSEYSELKLTDLGNGSVSANIDQTSQFERELFRVTTGSFHGNGILNKNVLTLTSDEYPDCVLTILFRGSSIQLSQTGDSSECGLGVDVDFTGTYELSNQQPQNENKASTIESHHNNYVLDDSIEARKVTENNAKYRGIVTYYKGTPDSGDTPYYYLLLNNKNGKIICFCGSKEVHTGCDKLKNFVQYIGKNIEIHGDNLDITSIEADYDCIDAHDIIITK